MEQAIFLRSKVWAYPGKPGTYSSASQKAAG